LKQKNKSFVIVKNNTINCQADPHTTSQLVMQAPGQERGHVSADRLTDNHQDCAAKETISMTWEWAQMSPSALAMSQGMNLHASLYSPAASSTSYLDTV
jgi:hypothetical protein